MSWRGVGSIRWLPNVTAKRMPSPPLTAVGHTPSLVLVVNDLRGGGTERQVAQMAVYWANLGIGVRVVTWTDDAATDFYRLTPPVERIHLGANRGLRGLPAAVGDLRRVLRHTAPCVVVGFGDALNALAWIASRFEGQRSCLAIRANPEATLAVIGRCWRLLAQLAYRRCDVVVTQTRASAEWLRALLGRDAEVIGNALRPMRLPALTRQPLVVTVGSLLPYKGHDVLLRAFARVASDFPGWTLAIIGEGKQRPALEGLIHELGLDGRASLPGQVRDVDGWLEQAGVFVLPSRQEGYPNALIEAMGMGVAVISTACPHGPAEIITNGVDGLLTPVDDVPAMADALLRLMADADLRSRLGAQALAVRARCDEGAVMRAWEQVLFGRPLGDAKKAGAVDEPLAHADVAATETLPEKRLA
jgi:glycosyltransferase involved in cell wall biosynthesis